MSQSIPVWLDCDTGHDDAFALLLAARHPSLNLIGVSTVYGNAPLERTTYNTRAVLKAIGREDIPVHVGVASPFCREAGCGPDIHGESGLDGTTCLPTPTVPARDDRPAVEAMYDALIAQPPGSAWVVATGCLTNIALLFALHPRLASHIAGLSIMGGAIGGKFTDAPMGTIAGDEYAGERFGNHTPWAEFNIYLDPESASAVFSNPVLAPKTTLITLDLTHQFIATPSVLELMLHGCRADVSEASVSKGHHQQVKQERTPAPVRTLFHEILTFFAGTYADVFGLTDGPPTHDPLAVAIILFPELFDDDDDGGGGDGAERFAVAVVTDGEHGASQHARNGDSQCGRTVATSLIRGKTGIRIPRSLKTDDLWSLLEECLTRAEQAVAQTR